MQDIVGGSITDGVAKIISLFKVDPNVALQHQTELEKINADMQSKVLDSITQMSLAQSATNTAEANNKNIFVAGWRPFIGWVCGFALATDLIVGPWCTFIAALFHKSVTFPPIDIGSLMGLLIPMLGLGAMRTYEKVAGVVDPKNAN